MILEKRGGETICRVLERHAIGDETKTLKHKQTQKTAATTNPHMAGGRVAVVGPSRARTQLRGGPPAAGDLSTHGTYTLGRSISLVRVPVRSGARASNSKH